MESVKLESMEQLNVIFIKMSASFPYLALVSSMELKSHQWNEDSLTLTQLICLENVSTSEMVVMITFQN